MTRPVPQPEQPLHRLMTSAGTVLYRCLSEVMALSLQPWKFDILDLEDEEYLARMPEYDRVAHLRLLVKEYSDRESHLGLAQTELDRVAHAVMADELRKLIPGSLVAGEEAPPADWDAVDNAPAGTYVWIVDAIDGSGPGDTVNYGFSANALLYRTSPDTAAVPLMSVVVTSSARMLGWISPGRVGAAQLNFHNPYTGDPDVIELLEPLVDLEEIRNDWIAAVAAQPKDRRRLDPLFDSNRWTLITLGGAPALPGLLLERLAAVVIPRPQTRHDAASLLPLASGMGVHFIDIQTGETYSDATVRRFFAGIERPTDSPFYKPIPAMVVARDFVTGLELAHALRQHWTSLEEGGKADHRG